MSVTGPCWKCQQINDLFGSGPVEPTHCYGKGDQPGTPGLIGSGFYCSCECRSWPHQPIELYAVAATEHPDDPEAMRDRYLALMVEHGHIIKKQTGAKP